MSAARKGRTQDASALAERLDSCLLPLHAERLRDLGPDGSGLFAHYAARVAQGAILDAADRDGLAYVLNVLPACDRYVVYRAGLGELGLALALAGRKVTLWEPNGARREAIALGIEALSKTNRSLRARLTLAEAPMDSISLEPGETSLGIAFTLLLDADPGPLQAATVVLSRHTALLYGPRHLLRAGPAGTEAAAADLLAKAGYLSFKPGAPHGLILATREAAPTRRPPGKFSFLPDRRP